MMSFESIKGERTDKRIFLMGYRWVFVRGVFPLLAKNSIGS